MTYDPMTMTQSHTSLISPPRRYILAIDLGSSSIKSAIISDQAEVIASASEPINTYFLPGGGAEQDPNQWWQAACRTARKVIQNASIYAGSIVAVCCASQWSVVVPVDTHANPLTRAVHWLDTRGAAYNQQIIKGFPKVKGYGFAKVLRWLHLTGLAPTQSGVDSLAHALFIKYEKPKIYDATHAFLEPMDFLTSRLTGRITATQKTMAPFMVVETSPWGARQYNDTLLHMAGIEKDKFPELIPNDGIIGVIDKTVAKDLGLDPSTIVTAGISDSNASIIGSGAVFNYEPIIYIGTSQYLTCHLPFQKTDFVRMMTTLPSPFPGRYYLLGEQGVGGKCVEFFLQEMIYPDDEFKTGPMPDSAYHRFNLMASESPAGSNGVIFLPWLNGTIVPDEDGHVRGGFINLSLKTTRCDLSRSIMEGLALNNRWVKEAAEKFIRRPISELRFSGGGALSDLWAQIHADMLHARILQVEAPVYSTLRGVALLGFLCLGILQLEDIAKRVKIKKIFEPQNDHVSIYDHIYAQYRQLFKQNRKIFQALNAVPQH